MFGGKGNILLQCACVCFGGGDFFTVVQGIFFKRQFYCSPFGSAFVISLINCMLDHIQ